MTFKNLSQMLRIIQKYIRSSEYCEGAREHLLAVDVHMVKQSLSDVTVVLHSILYFYTSCLYNEILSGREIRELPTLPYLETPLY